MLYCYIILIIIILLTLKKIEYFQYFNDKSFGFVNINNPPISIYVDDHNNCKILCRHTPHCTGYNYFQNSCILYKNIKNPTDITVKNIKFY